MVLLWWRGPAARTRARRRAAAGSAVAGVLLDLREDRLELLGGLVHEDGGAAGRRLERVLHLGVLVDLDEPQVELVAGVLGADGPDVDVGLGRRRVGVVGVQ